MIDERGNPIGARVPPFTGFIPNGDISDRIARFGEYPSSPSSGNAYARAALERLMPLDAATWFAAAEKPLVFLTPFFGDVVSICAPLGRYRIHEDNDSRLKGRHLEALHRRLSAVFFMPETICAVAKSKGIELDPRGARFDFAPNQVADGVVAARSEDSSDRGRHARWTIAERIEGVDSRA